MIHLEQVLKISLQDVLKTSWRCLEDVFQDVLKTFWRRLQNVLKTSWRCLEDVLKTSWRRLEDVLKTFLQDVLKTSWRRIAKTNILVLTKTSWRRLLKTKTKDVFKTPSRRLYQDECLLRMFPVTWSTKSSNVFLLFKWGIKTRFNIFIRTVLRLVSALVQWPQLLYLYLPGSQVL